MKALSTLFVLTMLIFNTAHAAMTFTSPSLSPMLNEYDQAQLTDEHGTKIPLVGVIFPNSSGASGIAAAKFATQHVSSVTGRREAPLYKAAGGKFVPMMAFAKMDTTTNLPVPVTLADTSGFAMTGDIAMGTHKITGLGDPTAAQDGATKAYVDKIAAINCAASAGGAASEALTCTGLLTTDTILAVSQSTAGANGTAINAYNTLVANGLTVSWTANPGAGAIVKVLVKHL